MAAPTIRLNEMKTEDPATKWTAGQLKLYYRHFLMTDCAKTSAR